jgi:hypothetical protein
MSWRGCRGCRRRYGRSMRRAGPDLCCIGAAPARQLTSAAACLAEDLEALCVHLHYPLKRRGRWRSTNLLERSLGEVRQAHQGHQALRWRDPLPVTVLGRARPRHRALEQHHLHRSGAATAPAARARTNDDEPRAGGRLSSHQRTYAAAKLRQMWHATARRRVQERWDSWHREGRRDGLPGRAPRPSCLRQAGGTDPRRQSASLVDESRSPSPCRGTPRRPALGGTAV